MSHHRIRADSAPPDAGRAPCGSRASRPSAPSGEDDGLARRQERERAVLGAGPGSERALDDALRAYQAERWPRNQAQIRWSHWLSRFYALAGGPGDTLRRLVFGLGGSALGQSIQRVVWARVATRAS